MMETRRLTIEDGQKALLHHIVEKGIALREKYGHCIDFDTLQKILKDGEFVRYPTRVEFKSRCVEPGFFAFTEQVSADDPTQGFVIYVHEHFKNRINDVPVLVLYHLVAVNYDAVATSEEAELFGATALGMKKEDYYRLLCALADQIPCPSAPG
jgi:hypothetical protein